MEDFSDPTISAYYIEKDGTKLMIIHNLSSTEEKTLTITEQMIKNPAIRADLVASATAEKNDHITLNGTELKMPPQSTVILKTK